jgi:hypothetical protein
MTIFAVNCAGRRSMVNVCVLFVCTHIGNGALLSNVPCLMFCPTVWQNNGHIDRVSRHPKDFGCVGNHLWS